MADTTPRIGSGLDVHAFGPDAAAAEVVLGGVTIASHAPLEGHSDADVVAHALIDALLGAAGLGDLGSRFGTDDPDLAGADSLRLLATVMGEVRAQGLELGNADVTVVAARPRIAPHREQMRAALAQALDVDVTRISVKATTTDGIGSIGRAEGVAAWALSLLVPRAE
jgi:2-C-methyl-D-erythritol 2,4-cyclodiphosphate synthase